MSESDGKIKRQSFIEDEQIEIKPSTELIPDEYERTDNGNMLVELICKQTDDEAKDLDKKLNYLRYSVNKTLIDRENIDQDWIDRFVTGVNDKTKERNYEGLIMIFAKVTLKNDVLKTIWGNFTSTKCPALKNKPKIFIFQISKRGLPADSALQTDLKMAYDTPSEADILIVYDKISYESSNNFLENLQEHISDYGNQEDIINLVSLSIGSETRPLVISTMTRKFFFTINAYRGHHHNITESHAEIKENLEKIIKYVKNMPDHRSKDKEKSLMSSLKKRFSMKSKNHPEKESDHAENKAQERKKEQLSEVNKEHKKLSEVKEKDAIAGPSKEKPKALKLPVEPIAVPPNKSPTRKSSIPVTPTRRNSTRTRTSSTSFGSKEDLPKRPAWK